MPDLSREAIAIEAANHPHFTENDANNYWSIRATEYAKQYQGDFKYMNDMRGLVESAIPLSPGRVKGILNCARKEGATLANDKFNSQSPVPLETPDIIVPAAPVEVPEFDDLDFSIDELPTAPADNPHMIELNAINERIKEIQSQIKDLTPQLDSLDDLIKESDKAEELLFADFQKRLNEIREEAAGNKNKKIQLAAELVKIKELLENQRRLHALTLQQLAAEEEFEKTKKLFDELRKDMPWDSQIMGYQWDDVCFMAANFLSGKNGVLNANAMGLGKTFESGALIDLLTLLFAEKFDRAPRILWLTKKTLRFSSQKELMRWSPDRKIIVLDGNENQREFALELAVATNVMVIANYDQLNTTSIKNFDWDFVFMDEVHKLKGGANSKPTQVFVNTKEICHKAKFIVPMSGSPIQNHPKEMWCYLHIFAPERFPDARHFERNYCFGWGQTDEDGNPIVQVDWDKIIRAMKDRVIRHSKEEVLNDLPDKTREFRYVELEGRQLEIYNSLRTEFFTWLDDQHEVAISFTAIIAQLTRLRQAALIPSSIKGKLPDGTMKQLDCTESAKVDEAMEIIEQYVGAGEQCVVFTAQFNEPLYELSKRLSAVGITSEQLTGETSNRFNKIETGFQNKEFDVLLVNRMSGGEGLNLQKSDQWEGGSNNAIFLDLWWNPESNNQAEDRVHRKGQRDNVTIHILQAEQSVDAFIAAKLEMKENMIQGIMGSDDLRTASDWKSLLMDLI